MERHRGTVTAVEVCTAELPFRFSFGHALAERRSTTNIYVKVTLADGTVGFGEGRTALLRHGRERRRGGRRRRLPAVRPGAGGPRAAPSPTTWPMALEPPRRARIPPVRPARRARRGAPSNSPSSTPPGDGSACRSPTGWGRCGRRLLAYDAVLPVFDDGGARAAGRAGAERSGSRQVKVKVGKDLDSDVRPDPVLRRLLGAEADLRVDANCAWTDEQALVGDRSGCAGTGSAPSSSPLPPTTWPASGG